LMSEHGLCEPDEHGAQAADDSKLPVWQNDTPAQSYANMEKQRLKQVKTKSNALDSSIHAFCKGCVRLADSPSIVVTRFPATRDSGETQERMALPSRCTVHAPHNAMPQPNFVPVISSESRKTHSNGVVGSTSTCTDFSLRRKLVIDGLPMQK
jgi:hypothetical protein